VIERKPRPPCPWCGDTRLEAARFRLYTEEVVCTDCFMQFSADNPDAPKYPRLHIPAQNVEPYRDWQGRLCSYATWRYQTKLGLIEE